MTKQEAYAEICKKTAAAHAAIKAAEKLADEFGASFTFKITYGIGGTYTGSNKVRRAALAKLTQEERDALGVSENSDEYGWQSSSQSC